MANTKEYKIVINGITESVKAVESLNKELANLEARIKALEGKSVGVKTSGGGSKSSSTGSLSEEEKIQKQIEQIDAKRVAYSKEIYQNYLAAKDVLKETVKDQNAIAASERLQANSYSNTIMGMKQELADIKSAMQTVDLGDTEKMGEMVKRANELNDALKKIEESYGQFGRNVGNYQSAFDGMQKISVTVGGVVREFGSAREASKTLKNELIGLEAAGQGDSEMAKQLRTELYKLQSAMDDATKSSKAMDEAMDFMQSFTAMASIGQGLKGFFGIDDSEIQRSIQKLVALQNVLKGIETLRKQMETSEGIGQLLTKGSTNIDKMVAGLTGAKVATEGLTMGSRAATVAVRGLSVALKGVGIGLVLEAINLLVQGIEFVSRKITDWVKGDADLIKEEKLLDSQLDYTNKKLEERNNLLGKSYYQGLITQEQYFRMQLQETTNAINDQIKALKEKAAMEGGRFNENINRGASGEVDMSFGAGSTSVNNLKELTQLWKYYSEAVLEGRDAMSKLNDETGTINSWFRSLIYTLDDTKDDLVQIGQIAIGEFLSRYQHAMETMQKDTKAGERELAELKKQMDDNEMLRTIFMNLDQYIPVESFRKRVQQIIDLIRGVKTEMGDLEQRTVEQVIRSEQLKIDAMKDGAAKRQAQRDLDKKKELADATLTAEDRANIEKKYQQRKLREEKAANQKSQNEAKKNARELLEVERDLSNLRISNMKEGLNKVLKQLEEERKLRLAKVEADGKLVAERQAEINIYYDKKILDAKKEWAEKVEKAYKDMWDNIYAYSLEIAKKMENIARQSYENNLQYWEYAKDEKYAGKWSKLPDYGVQGVNQLSKSTQEVLGIEQKNNKELDDIYLKRSLIVADYWKQRIKFETSAITSIYDAQVKVENEEFEKQKRDRLKNWDEQQKLQSDWYDKRREQAKGLAEQEKWSQKELDAELINIEKEYQKAATALYKQYTSDEKAIVEQHNKNLEKLEQEKVNNIRNINMEFFRQRLQELRDFQTAIANLESKQPVYNFFGTTNFKQTNANNRIILKSYEEFAKSVLFIKKKLQENLDSHEITFDDFQNANRELDAFVDNLGQKMDEIKYKLSLGGQIQQFVKDMQQYIQAAVQSFDQIMNAVWDAQDTQFEKQQELLDKMNEELDKKLDEQQEIVQQHKDAIDSIEEELATSRGDRRQHLIDQINAEMAAQRAAQKQAQKLAKEKEALDKKQEKLDKDRKKAEYKRNMLQAVVNGALAVTMAAVNAWPMPAIAMMAAAAAATAAQIAIMASNKPYAKGGQLDGGVAVGNRHRDGGIKVLGGRAEIEGGEFITNRLTTEKNIDLLDYINSKKKRINLDDLMEFYSSGKVKRNISSISPKAKFADGGTIPTISNDYAFDDRLISAFEDYSNRPVVVSVVDINNRQSAVKNVQVLAGLSE